MTATDALETDVAVVGAGLAGSAAAVLLARQGLRVAIVDPQRTYPSDFRCEKLSGEQLALLTELGLVGPVLARSTPVADELVARGGRVVGLQTSGDRTLRYDTFVNSVRSALPDSATFHEGRVEEIRSAAIRPSIRLSSGREIEARIIVMATGPGEKLRAGLGLKRRTVRSNHSISIDFDLVTTAGQRLSDRALIYYGERAGDGIAFATFFPLGDATRCNFFCHLDPKLLFVRMFRKRPLQSVLEVMPGLKAVLGDAVVRGDAEIRITDLYETDAPGRDGVVLIGDAQHATCPVTGTGVTRVLTDVRQLCTRHIPAWLANANGAIDASRIAEFYADPRKLAFDRKAAEKAERDRLMSVSTALPWRARRLVSLAKARLHTTAKRQGTAVLTLRGRATNEAPIMAGPPKMVGH